MTAIFPPDRIQWHEGMLLSPQHFQQESARIDQLIAWHALAADPLAWGVRRLEIDDRLGQRVTLAFRGGQRNPAIPPGVLRFDPPAGADLIGKPLP